MHGVRAVRSPGLLTGARDVGGMRVLGCAAALVQTLATGHPGGAALLDRALQTRRVHPAELAEALERAGGGRGIAGARAAVDAAADGTASVAERAVVAALRAGGVTGFRCNHPVGRYAVDIAFPAERVAVEVDGFAFHSDPARFRSDRRRQNVLVLAGWTVVRFTWLDAVERPGHVVGEVWAALRLAAIRTGASSGQAAPPAGAS